LISELDGKYWGTINVKIEKDIKSSEYISPTKANNNKKEDSIKNIEKDSELSNLNESIGNKSPNAKSPSKKGLTFHFAIQY
jgi:hypothetical protein